MSTLKPQTIVAGRYTVEKLVAEGGQGSVYAVVDKTGRRRAMKVLHGLLRGSFGARVVTSRQSRPGQSLQYLGALRSALAWRCRM